MFLKFFTDSISIAKNTASVDYSLLSLGTAPAVHDKVLVQGNPDSDYSKILSGNSRTLMVSLYSQFSRRAFPRGREQSIVIKFYHSFDSGKFSMAGIQGYTFSEELHVDGDLILYRAFENTDRTRPLLVLAFSSDRPTPLGIAKLENEYGHREQLKPDFAAQPLRLVCVNGQTFLVLQDPGGEPLNRMMGRPMDPLAFLRLSIELAQELSKIHAAHIIHRDIKPANILFDAKSNRAWFTGFGFGIASHSDIETRSEANSEELTGTFGYMAPEQTGRMNRSVDFRSDLYSLGISFYEMLTGILPFTASDPMEWIHCHVARTPRPITEQGAHIPDPLAAIVYKLLQKSPEERYQSASGLEGDLRVCLEQWKSSGKVEAFDLGTFDRFKTLPIPDQLFGRADESAQLQAAILNLKNANTSDSFIVSGAAGTGKSALVGEFQKYATESGAIVASGKFDPFHRDSPNALIALAFQGFFQHLLYKSGTELSYWRDQLNTALIPNAQLIIDLIPDLGLVLGKQEPLPTLPVKEAKVRFQTAFFQFLRVFAKPEHPLVLILDDLQFIDSASLQLLELLLTARERPPLLFIGAYRSEGPDSEHGFHQLLERLKAHNLVKSIALKPLLRGDLDQLVQETLGFQGERTRELSEVIYQKTEGIPLFSIQFFKGLYEDYVLSLDRQKGEWLWDIDRVRLREFSENVAVIMLGKMNRLPEATTLVLKQLACFGSTVSLTFVSAITGLSLEDALRKTIDAVNLGYVVQTPEFIKFSHEHIWQAAYALLSEQEREAEHLRIGRALLASLSDEQIETNLFGIIAQLNRGKKGITVPAEISLLRRLNYRAGNKARMSSAYQAAAGYFSIAADCISLETMTLGYAETHELYLELLDCTFLVGDYDRAASFAAVALNHASNKADKVKIYILCMRLYQLAGKLEDALKTGFEALQLYDIHFPDSETDLNVLYEAERMDIERNIGGRTVDELVSVPFASDENAKVINNILTDVQMNVSILRPKSRLNPLVVVRVTNYSLIYGPIEKSCMNYLVYARILIVERSDLRASSEFRDLAVKLDEKFNSRAYTGSFKFFYAVFLHHWHQPVHLSLPIIETAFDVCHETGNFSWCSHLAFWSGIHAYMKGSSLEECLQFSERYLVFIKGIRNEPIYNGIRLYRQVVLSLRDPEPNPSSPDNEMSEVDRLALIKRMNFVPAIGAYNIFKQQVAFLFGHYEEAKEFGLAGVQMMAPGTLMVTSFFFYHALTLIALQRKSGNKSLQQTLEALNGPLQKLQLMAEGCPENYHNRLTLLNAEIAALEGRVPDAIRAYDEAIHSAHKNGFLQNEALATELAAQFYLTNGFEFIGYSYLAESRACYLRWGANAKAKQLEHIYPRLIPFIRRNKQYDSEASGADIDVMTVIMASQAISKEMDLNKVIDRLMTIVIENAGAVRGLLILSEGETFKIVAEATTGQHIEVKLRETPLTSTELPESIFHYVTRSKEKILIDDALASTSFVFDDYIQKKQAKSVLFLPMIKHGHLVGVLYLENHLIPGAFTADRMIVLEMLCSQAAISVENARLYQEVTGHKEHLEELVKQRTLALNQKTSDLDAMLQNMDLGVCTVITGNRIHHEYSDFMCTIFESSDFAGKGILDTIFKNSTLGVDKVDQVTSALDMIIGEDSLSFETNSHLLTREMVFVAEDGEHKTIQMNWNEIKNDAGIVEKVLFTAQDVSKLRALESESAKQKEELEIISRIINLSPERFDGFISSAQRHLSEIRNLIVHASCYESELVAGLFRHLHTIKGNSRALDFTMITDAAHTAEQVYAQLRKNTEAEWNVAQQLQNLELVEHALIRYVEINESKLSGRGKERTNVPAGSLIIEKQMITSLLRKVEGLAESQPSPELSHLRDELKIISYVSFQELVCETLDTLASLVNDLHKPMPRIANVDEALYFDSKLSEALNLSFMHIARNCMDHGIEMPEDRLRLGKPERGTIAFEYRRRGPVFELLISDDGRGLALHKLYEKGVLNGLLPALNNTPRETVAALIFHSGLSTAEVVTQTSGRGVGMDAVRVFLKEQGSDIRIELDPMTQGLSFTPFKFVISLPAALILEDQDKKVSQLSA